MNKMKVQVSLKTSSKIQVEAKIRLVVFAVDIVATVKERIATALEVPFPEQDLVFGGTILNDDTKIFDCGIKDGSPLDFVVRATDATLVHQLADLMPTGSMASDELAMMYALKHGVNVTKALEVLGFCGNFKDFLSESKQVNVDAQGQVSLVSPIQQVVKTPDTQPNEDIYEDQDVQGSGKLERICRLEKLFACVNDLCAIEKEMDAMSKQLERSAAPRKLEPIAEVVPKGVSVKQLPEGWSKKESSKHPGRFYYVNKETGETSWKLPEESSDSPKVSAPPGLLAPPGLEKPVPPPPGLEMVVPQPPGLGKPVHAPPGLSLPMNVEAARTPICLSLINEIPAALSEPKYVPTVISLFDSL